MPNPKQVAEKSLALIDTIDKIAETEQKQGNKLYLEDAKNYLLDPGKFPVPGLTGDYGLEISPPPSESSGFFSRFKPSAEKPGPIFTQGFLTKVEDQIQAVRELEKISEGSTVKKNYREDNRTRRDHLARREHAYADTERVIPTASKKIENLESQKESKLLDEYMGVIGVRDNKMGYKS